MTNPIVLAWCMGRNFSFVMASKIFNLLLPVEPLFGSKGSQVKWPGIARALVSGLLYTEGKQKNLLYSFLRYLQQKEGFELLSHYTCMLSPLASGSSPQDITATGQGCLSRCSWADWVAGDQILRPPVCKATEHHCSRLKEMDLEVGLNILVSNAIIGCHWSTGCQNNFWSFQSF